MDPTAKEGCGITSVLTKVLERNLLSKCLPKKRKSNQKPNDMASKVKMSAEDKKYQAKWDLDTLRQAREIMADKTRFSAAQGMAKQQMMALGGIVNAGKKPPMKQATKKK